MKKESVAITDALILFFSLYAVVNYLYLCAIETLICRREMNLIGSTSVLHKIRYMVFKIPY